MQLLPPPQSGTAAWRSGGSDFSYALSSPGSAIEGGVAYNASPSRLRSPFGHPSKQGGGFYISMCYFNGECNLGGGMIEKGKESKTATPEKRDVESGASKSAAIVMAGCLFAIGVIFVLHEVEIVRMLLERPR